MKRTSINLILGTAVFGAWMVAVPASAGSMPVTALACSAGLAGDHPAGRDNDRDGVPDSEDWCTGGSAGARVGVDGCADGEMAGRCPVIASAATKPLAPVAMDSDGDGVLDAKDRCAGTPRGADVDSAGCPAPTVTDSDGDGVENDDDDCPGTAKGIAVNRHGCVEISKVVLKGVSFATGSAKLQPGASDTLRSVAAAMKANKALKVEIGGHTDSVGLEAKNQALSQRRAQSVKAFLVGEGVAADRLTTVGYGSAKPVDSNDTAEGRANNRRVEFRVVAD